MFFFALMEGDVKRFQVAVLNLFEFSMKYMEQKEQGVVLESAADSRNSRSAFSRDVERRSIEDNRSVEINQ